MIDWLTFVAPLSHVVGPSGPFYAGEIVSTMIDSSAPHGIRPEWHVLKRTELVGSYSSTIQVRSTFDEAGRPALWVSGSPAKWFQGHNIFGSDYLPGLVLEMLERVCRARGLVPTPADRAAWLAGCIKLLRVDVNFSYCFVSLAVVRNALFSLDATANLKHRGRGHFTGDSLLFGSKPGGRTGSRRWSLMFYAKGAEISLPGRRLPTELPNVEQLFSHAQGLLRLEVRVLSLQLVDEGLQFVSAWSDNTASDLHARLTAGLQISEASMHSPDSRVQGLRPAVQGAFALWQAGSDLREIYPKATFYRHRAELLQHGVDIAIKCPVASREPSNVVPLRVVLQGRPAGIPDWARGTPLYFDPRARLGG